MRSYAIGSLATFLGIMVLAVGSSAFGQPVTFMGVGVLPGDTSSAAYSVSRNGDVVTGASIDGTGPEAFIYITDSAAKTGISFPSGWTTTFGEGIDADAFGNYYVAGTGKNASAKDQAFFYDATAAAFTAIPFLSGGLSNMAHAIQRHPGGDLLVVGRSDRVGPSDSKYHAFRWRSSDGDLEDLGETETDSGNDGNRGEAWCVGVRPNGQHVVRGFADTGYPSGGNNPVAFSWNSGDPINYCLWWADLSAELSPRNSIARGTSADGRYITGASTIEDSFASCGTNRVAYLHDTDDKDVDVSCNYPGGHYHSLQYCVVPDGTGGPSCIWGSTMLGELPGHEGRSEGLGVSLDGQVVVGWARLLLDTPPPCTWGEPEEDRVAFIWDPTNGMRDLKDVLEDYGLDLTGWKLWEAKSISSDGTVICGIGHHTDVGAGIDRDEAWVATIGRVGPTGACCRHEDLSCEDNVQADSCTSPDVWHQGKDCVADAIVCCADPFADADNDGDVDQKDFGIWQACYSGNSTAHPAGGTYPCVCFNRDAESEDPDDIDDLDFVAFETCWSGPTVTALTTCDD